MASMVGGQAVLEGVMMRGPGNWAVAVRTPNGEIAQVSRSIESKMATNRLLRLPIVRGVMALGESLAIGFRALAISANYAAQEEGEELEPETVQRFSLIHPRCGTAFLLWVMVIAVFVFAFFGRPHWYWLIAERILLLPLIAGLAYELIRFAGKHQRNRLLMALLAPGLWLQRLTTRQPTLDQIEVSIRALQDVLEREGQATPSAARVEVMA